MLRRQSAPSAAVGIMRTRKMAIKKAEPGGKGAFVGMIPADVIEKHDAYRLYDMLYGGAPDYWMNKVFIAMDADEDRYIAELTKQINVVESIYVCPSCGYNRIHVSQDQSRSADESATSRYRCMRCGYQWAYSS